jgi:uncharacterized phage-associated protein
MRNPSRPLTNTDAGFLTSDPPRGIEAATSAQVLVSQKGGPEVKLGFSPIVVANELIAIAGSDGIDHLTLQKELYITHGLHLALTRTPLIRGGFQAWQYGPVCPDVYHQAKRHSGWKIAEPLTTLTLRDEESDSTPNAAYAQRLLRNVWEGYRNFTPYQLVALTHRPGTPWFEITDGGSTIRRNQQIPDLTIQRYYEAVLRAAQQQ